jgi:ligand-binding sensor domain-containing protein/signal transduction histidine kinase
MPELLDANESAGISLCCSERAVKLVFGPHGRQGESVIPMGEQTILSRCRPGWNSALLWRWVALLVALLGSSLLAIGAVGTGEYFIDVTTGEKGEQGLPNSSVTAITQTPDGYLWVGTYDGLARFDGERFTKFYPENTPGLRNARIRRLAVTKDGTLWISAHDGSITAYRQGNFTLEWPGEGLADSAANLISDRGNQPLFVLRTGEFIRWNEGTGTNRWEMLRSPGASSGMVVAEDAAGEIWCSGRNQQLYRMKQNRFEAVAANGGLKGNVIRTLTADGEGRIWAGTDREVAVWNGSQFETMTPTNGEPELNVTFLRVLKNGDIWMVANERVREVRGREWVEEVEETKDLFTSSARERTGLHQDAKGGLWLYDYGRGLFNIRTDGSVRQLATEENFPGEKVDAFFEDREGNIWAGVDRGGLVRVREKRFNVLAPRDGTAVMAAVSVTEDADGAIWVGTFGGGLQRWWHNEWKAFTLPGGTRRGFVFSVYPDEGGKLWTSAGDEDLHVGSAGNFTLFTPAVHAVKALLRASDRRLWIGTKSGLGVLANGQFRQFYPEPDGVGRADVRALAEDVNGTIWAGAGDGVLYRLAADQVSSFRAADAWSGQPIWSLLPDTNGVVWVGTFRGGLLRFADGNFTRFTMRDGLPDDVICQLLDDGAGRLWVGSKQGIFHVEKSKLHAAAAGATEPINCTAYGRYDGLPSLECSDSYQPAAWRTRDGRLLFTTLKGVVAVRPGEVAVNPLPPPVVIESAEVDGVEQAMEIVPPRNKSQPERRLVVAPGWQQVRIHFTGLSLVSPDRVRFKYKLEGLDREWSEPSALRVAEYNFLPPREYLFHVLACNNDGVWNEEGALLKVVVLPRFYETWTFKLGAALLGLGLVVFTVRRVYVRRYRRKLEMIQRQRAIEQDRARIAKDIHDDLGAGLTHIALLTELARRDAVQEWPQHMTQISDMARELTRNMDEIVWAVDPQNDTLDSLVSYVSKFAQDYLSVAKIRCRLDVPAELPPYVLPAEVRHNLFLALKEALHNVVKHAQATEVWLRLALRPRAFTIVIEDNGRGLHAPVAEGPAGRKDRLTPGHGLANMTKRLQSSGGTCVIHAAPGQGTRVEFSVDLSALRSPEVVTGANSGSQRT